MKIPEALRYSEANRPFPLVTHEMCAAGARVMDIWLKDEVVIGAEVLALLVYNAMANANSSKTKFDRNAYQREYMRKHPEYRKKRGL